MHPSISLKGIFAPLPTPFDGRGDVALEALAQNVAHLNRYALAGYVVLGSNGEAGYVSWEEKAAVWRAARQAIPAGKLMIAGTGCESTRQTIALTRVAAEQGADAALVVTPHYYGGMMTSDALVAHYVQVAEAVPIPVILYVVPGFTHVDMSPVAIARAGEHPNVVGIKDTAGNVAKMADTVRLAGPEFQVLAGSAGFFFPGLAVGAVGGILALANVAPQMCLEMYEAFEAGRWTEAAELQRRALPLNAAVTTRFGIAGLKAALDMLGQRGGLVRSPLRDLDEAGRQELRTVLVEGGLLASDE
ncbi:MAG: dihydrodipicolinate synthase family protein [Anaerolineae bacterium]|nr:dihydrodipicolinate synthase family protein [Anaerolineae bacterium]